MKYLINIKDYIVEKSIGSENIRNKHYSDLPKDIYYSIVNLDPTSVRKKDFSKPGRYVKWLILQYKKNPSEMDLWRNSYFEDGVGKNDNPINALQIILKDKDRISELNKYLFIFSTQWYRSKSKKSTYVIGGRVSKTVENDIFKFKSINEFEDTMKKMMIEYEADTEDAKFEVVYSDEKMDILIPINFTASFETSKNTQWCSQSYSGYSDWSERSLMFRIIPKDTKFDRVKITWENKYGKNSNTGYDNTWYIAGSKYPEVTGIGNPFKKEKNGKERWDNKIDEFINFGNNPHIERYTVHFQKVRDTMALLNDDIKKRIVSFYDKKKK